MAEEKCMEWMHQILTQLEKAISLSTASTVGDRRIAVILLDNIVELTLGRQVECALMTRIAAAKWPPAIYESAREDFKGMLAFALRELKLLSEPERAQLAFCHKLRNPLYHAGAKTGWDFHSQGQTHLINAGIDMYLQILRHRLPISWRPTGMSGMISPSTNSGEVQVTTDFARWLDLTGNVIRELNIRAGDVWQATVRAVLPSIPVEPLSPGLLSRYLVEKVSCMKDNYFYLIKRAGENPHGWTLNDLLRCLSFERLYAVELQSIEGPRRAVRSPWADEAEDKRRAEKRRELEEPHSKGWRPLREKDFGRLARRAADVARHRPGEALIRFLTLDQETEDCFLDLDTAVGGFEKADDMAFEAAREDRLLSD